MAREIHLHIYVPPEEPQPAPGNPPDDAFALGPQVFVPHIAEANPPAFAQAVSGARRQPLRDRVRERIIDAVQSASPVPVGAADVAGVLSELGSERPLLDWLANGGLQKLIALVLELLKLAA